METYLSRVITRLMHAMLQDKTETSRIKKEVKQERFSGYNTNKK